MAEVAAANRRLAGILSADVAGYSHLTGNDETGTLNQLKARRKEIIAHSVRSHVGRVVNAAGKLEKAQATAKQILAHSPRYTVQGWVVAATYKMEKHLSLELDALRAAGLPEG